MNPVTSAPYSTPKSAELAERLRRSLPAGDTRTGTYYDPYPIAMSHGEGCYLWDVDGNRYVDCLNNYSSLVHGHGRREIKDAILAQVQRATSFGAPHVGHAELAERICARVSSVESIRYTNSGTEAAMMAVRGAQAFTGKSHLVKASMAYHGTWGPVVASSIAWGVPDVDQSWVHDIEFNDVASLEGVMAEHGENVAAVILEPVLGHHVVAGTTPFFEAARKLCDDAGALLIIDEIVAFRLSWGGYQEVIGVTPDLTTFGKIIGGGLPIGAFGGRADVMELFDPRRPEHILHDGTMNGYPLGTAAGIVALDLLTPSEIERINGLGALLAERLTAVLADVATVEQCGSLLQIDVPAGPSTAAAAAAAHKLRALHRAAIGAGVFLASRGFITMSTAMDEQVVGEIEERMAAAVATLD